MNLDDLKDKFDRAGGKEILGQYAREHVLGFALLQTALQGTSQKSLEIVRLSVSNKILGKLRRKYRRYIDGYLQREKLKPKKPAKRSRDIWILWLDGMEQAPEVVQRCCRSVQESFPDRPVHILTEENYRDAFQFNPEELTYDGTGELDFLQGVSLDNYTARELKDMVFIRISTGDNLSQKVVEYTADTEEGRRQLRVL